MKTVLLPSAPSSLDRGGLPFDSVVEAVEAVRLLLLLLLAVSFSLFVPFTSPFASAFSLSFSPWY